MDKKKTIIFAVVLIIILIALVVFAGNRGTQNANNSSSNTNSNSKSASSVSNSSKVLKGEELFTTRDLDQEPDLQSAIKYEISDNQEIKIDKEGTYIITGTGKNVQVYVEVGDEDKVQLVLDNLNISNEDKEIIHVENADKVFITSSNTNSLSYKVKDAENATAAILSRSDIVLNGKGTLDINSENNGINGKDDIKITGGTYNITSSKNCIRANDSIRICGGTFNLKASTDGLHTENDEYANDYIFINSCTLNIEAADDGIHAQYLVQIDGGNIDVNAGEGIEATCVQINGGTINIEASDDGINAAKKSDSYSPYVIINDGDIKINMGKGDTDGIDSNGDIIINGGTIDITGNSIVDYDGKAEKNGGTLIINGEETDTIPNQFMGGMPGGMGGQKFPMNINGEFDGERKRPH